MEVYFRDGWHLRDERSRGLPLIKTHGIFVDQDFASPHELAKSEYYRGFLAKFEANWSAVVGFSDPDDEWCLVFERGDREGHFDHREQGNLVRFAGPLSQAAALARSISYTCVTGALNAYQSVGCASFLINDLGRVARFNEKAQSLIGDGLELHRGILRSSHPPDNLSLDALIASHRRTMPYAACGNHVAVIHRMHKRPLIVRAIPLTGVAASIFSSAATMLLISDADERRPPTHRDTLIRAFGLTPTEAMLACHLERELSISDAALHMNIAIETARTHLKRILAKTETTRQQELLMLMRRLTP